MSATAATKNSNRNHVRPAMGENGTGQPAYRYPKSTCKKPRGVDDVGTNLTELARRGKLCPTIGRDREVSLVVDLLVAHRPVEVALAGREGSGRLAVVEGVAQRIADGEVPEALAGCSVVHVPWTNLADGPSRTGADIGRLLQEGARRGTIAVFSGMEHFDRYYNRGPSETEKALWYWLQKLGTAAITIFAVGSAAAPDVRGVRRIVPINPLPDQTAARVTRAVAARERPGGEPMARRPLVDEAIRLCLQNDRERALPDLALRTLELAGVRCREGRRASRAIVRRAFADLTGVVERRRASSLSVVDRRAARLVGLGERLRARVVGQDEVIETVVDRLSIGMLDFGVRGQRPTGVLLFAGPTGVGKTELARALAEELYADEDALVRLDMSEYSSATDVWKLISPPPGIVGHDQRSALLREVAERPRRLVLFDEIEKAHPTVHRLLLQVFDEGRLTQSGGETVSFSQTTIVMTTNALANGIKRTPGFGADEHGWDAVNALDGVFPPELVNRIDAICSFARLERRDAERITRDVLLPRWHEAHPDVTLDLSESAIGHVAAKGYSPSLGARELERALEREVLLPAAQAILAGAGRSLSVDLQEGRVMVRPRARAERNRSSV